MIEDMKRKVVSRVTMGRLVLETAQGPLKVRSVSPEEVRELSRDISQRIMPKIDEIRDEQRRALEDSKPVVLL
jgi:hypothetical protein